MFVQTYANYRKSRRWEKIKLNEIESTYVYAGNMNLFPHVIPFKKNS